MTNRPSFIALTIEPWPTGSLGCPATTPGFRNSDRRFPAISAGHPARPGARAADAAAGASAGVGPESRRVASSSGDRGRANEQVVPKHGDSADAPFADTALDRVR